MPRIPSSKSRSSSKSSSKSRSSSRNKTVKKRLPVGKKMPVSQVDRIIANDKRLYPGERDAAYYTRTTKLLKELRFDRDLNLSQILVIGQAIRLANAYSKQKLNLN